MKFYVVKISGYDMDKNECPFLNFKEDGIDGPRITKDKELALLKMRQWQKKYPQFNYSLVGFEA